ncbi:MAG: SMP-30/gluconolactonase/LRE family protein [Pseudomonadota bacterium]
MMDLQCVSPAGDWCGEAATWSAAEDAVYWVDINRFLIHRFEIATGATLSWQFKEPVVALSLTRRDDTLLVATGSGLLLWRPSDDTRTPFGWALDGWPEVRLNDGRAAPNGDFWVGSMKNNVQADGELGEVGPGQGILFRITPSGESSIWREGIGVSNTLCWSPDGARFYFGDTLENEVRVYDVDSASGDISGERPFFAGFDRGLPDGSTIDEEGYLWNCRYAGGCVVRVAPDGTVDRVIDLPVTNVTTCTFGGPDRETLFITTAALGRAPGDRLAGGLFAIKPGVAGLPENRFGWSGH